MTRAQTHCIIIKESEFSGIKPHTQTMMMQLSMHFQRNYPSSYEIHYMHAQQIINIPLQ